MGAAYLSEIEGLKNALQSGGVIVLLISAYWHVLVPIWVLILAWAVQKVIEYSMGYLDEKYLGWSAAQNRYATSTMNPFFSEMSKEIKEIKSILYGSRKTNP